MLKDMAYSNNPFLPRVRMEAVNLVRLKGWGVREAARHMGISPGTLSKWMAKAPRKGSMGIPTLSSAPHTHPNAISQEIEKMIVAEREKHGRCGQVIWETLKEQGIVVGLNTVHRTLDRYGLTNKYSPWKKRHISEPRPLPEKPGDLVELDTIHMMDAYRRIYVYTLIDVCTRWAFAWATKKIGAGITLEFLARAREASPFSFQTLQSDHGPEFSSWFTGHITMSHRHIRVGKPNDNAHIERFNRTIQDELLWKVPTDVQAYQKALPPYLRYYNVERKHMGIEFKTPMQKVAILFPRSWG
jgi:transposase InsO family protein